jgi:ligand-binding sensor domain-containing protein/signal transduction histidine kinase/DNA-binding response OmpR family regulator
MRFLIISVIVFLSTLTANGRFYYFRHYRNDNGLSNNTVMDCIQDRRGFIWFGTKEGLTRFDGFQFKIFLHNPSVTNSLADNFISSLCEDRDGWIWIGTAAGVCYYNPDRDFFGTINSGNVKIENLILDIKADNNNSVWIATLNGSYKYNKENDKLDFYPASKYFSPLSIDLTKAGDIWFSATDGMIYKYDARTDNFISYRILTSEEVKSSVRPVNIIDAGDYGLIVSTDMSGLKRFEPNTGKITPMFEKNIVWNNVLIRTSYLYNDGEIWVGSESGIYICNFKTGYFKNLQMVRTDPYSISNNAIRTITKDREGGVWIGTFYGGVNYLPQDNKPFEKFYPTGLPGALNGNVVREIRADSYGNIWMGTEDAGLIKLDQKTGTFINYSDGYGQVKIDSRNIQGVLVDDDDLWIGTFDKGIYILNIPGDKIISHFDLSNENNGLNTNSFITFLKTTDGNIYAGTVIGLYRYDRRSSSFNFLDDVASGTFIHSLYEDDAGNIWIGTYGRGLYRYDRSSGNCEKVLSVNGDYENLKNERITCITEDNNQRIWFTTEGNGFSYFDRRTGKINRYIPGKDVEFAVYCAMLQDGNGNMWITSTRGLLRLDPSNGKYITYTRDDGLLDNNFSYNSAYQDKNGKMYFGTTSGLVSFYPADIKENIYNPPVYFTGLQVNGREYNNNPSGSPDFKSVLVTDRISLKYYQSSLSVDFVSPSFTSPDLIMYRYKMEGSDPDWVQIKGNRKVYYTNLLPGEYNLRVISSPDGNSWSPEEAVLNIKISPPFWLSAPAFAVYLIVAGFIIYIMISSYIKKNVLEHQRKIDIIETSKEKEILNAKINFFTNITHEVRTPLTLIKGPLDRILKSGIKNSKDTEDNLSIIKRNTDRLLNLTNQLLDFRKTEREMFKLNFIMTDICELVGSTFNLFLPYSAEKSISFQMHSPVNHFNIAVDREAITKILSNLLANGIKYADNKVDLLIELETEKENILRIRVNSDGKLIPEELREKIFEPFFQINFDKPGEKGTGLGLSLARSLAELHHGRLFLDEKVRSCNSFVLEVSTRQEESIERVTDNGQLHQAEHHEFEIFGSLENSLPNILLAEDEIDMGRFIAKEIAVDYNVILTHSGDEALKALKKYNIILVVSDVIMPGINGYDLCRQIKSNIEYSHIPVILLTATIHLNAKIEGLDSGADAYIEKPFSTDLLIAQIGNLIKNSGLNRQNFLNSPLTHFKSVAMNKTDEEFLKKLHSTLMDNISENDLSVEKIAVLMGISVSTLYRKVKALTDLNSVEYIRLARLKKAAELLSEGNYRINEISYLVGFSSPSYFATSFQKQFGISPSQFIRNLK